MAWNGEDLFMVVTVVSTIMLFLSGWPTIRKIQRVSSSQGFSVIPFIACFVSCTLWTKYGILSNDSLMIAVNLIGAVIEAMYVVIFYTHTEHKKSVRPTILWLLFFLFSVLFYTKMVVKDHEKALYHQGVICAGFNIINYASPLAAAATVVRTKSTKSMSLIMSFVYCIVALEWLIYGWVHSDNFIKVPNFCGIILSSLQLSLFVIYPTSKKRIVSKVGTF